MDILNELTTREKILTCAANLFAEKGYTETSIRELAMAVGVKGSSLYNHFPSKNTILKQMLDDYYSYNTDVFKNKDISGILRENPNTDGILRCLQLSFPADRREYYQKVLFVILQEQLRNPVVRGYISEHFILRSEKNLKIILGVLVEMGILRQDTDHDYWAKLSSCLFYSFATRMMLGIGDNAPDFTGKSMAEMLRSTFDMMFEKHGTAKDGPGEGGGN